MTDPPGQLAATPSALVGAARELMQRPAAGTLGLWPRAAALVARGALEDALRDLWQRRAVGLGRATTRAQLACLPHVLGDRSLASEIAFAWSALSTACHHHAYELAPTATELQRWIDTVDRLITQIECTRRADQP
jgi:hypothetical protein